MNITEEQKQEADSIVEKYRPLADTWDCYHDTESTDKNEFKCAIQDRQSVLDSVLIIFQEMAKEDNEQSLFHVILKIAQMREQIEYLKSKL